MNLSEAPGAWTSAASVVLTTLPILALSVSSSALLAWPHRSLQREGVEVRDRHEDSPVVTTSTWVLALSMRSAGAVVVSLT